MLRLFLKQFDSSFHPMFVSIFGELFISILYADDFAVDDSGKTWINRGEVFFTARGLFIFTCLDINNEQRPFIKVVV